jgi:hypothetical protein
MANDINAALQFFKTMQSEAQAALVSVLNETAVNLRKAAITEIGSQLNLTPEYISRHISVRERANVRNLRVTISAESRPVLLERYESQQHWRPGKTVPQRTDGVSVQVKRSGARKKMKSAFFIRLRGSDTIGLALRTGTGKNAYEVLHGPSVAQAYSSVRDDIEPSQDDLLALFFERFNP